MKRLILILCSFLLLSGCVTNAEHQEKNELKEDIIKFPMKPNNENELVLPQGEFIVGDFFPEEVVSLSFECNEGYGKTLTFTTEDQTFISQIIESTKTEKMTADVPEQHGFGGTDYTMRLTDSDGIVTTFCESVNTMSMVISRGEVEFKALDVDDSQMFVNPLIRDLLNQYKDILVVHESNEIVPIFIEVDHFTIKGTPFENRHIDYEVIKDFDFVGEGFTAFENDIEIHEFSKELGKHTVILKRNNHEYLLYYEYTSASNIPKKQ